MSHTNPKMHDVILRQLQLYNYILKALYFFWTLYSFMLLPLCPQHLQIFTLATLNLKVNHECSQKLNKSGAD